jgi:hypothetical protein
MTEQITVHLRATDGATFTLTVPLPTVTARATVRIGRSMLTNVQATQTWTGSTWR